ncbi:hypothetical protein DQW50_00480 [Halorubrum sp. 48-1-W]|uniref:tyrosine-type recombinase/integrase n=1 Tax=Halorubrum sp. 48-1-W TaxID=2249761 RepID=UPI000DCB2E21|nr:site-specific integrase [Halorubrum sp. 48-1-W]RAW46904.1 hypothetical protein DQW50_00480 [Halorubrum sp. 48-1-W]
MSDGLIDKSTRWNDRSDRRPLTPREGMNRFLRHREKDSSSETISTYAYRLGHFVRWCESEATLMNLNDLRGSHLEEYWYSREDDLGASALKNEFGTIKKLLEFGVAVGSVEPWLPEIAQELKPSLAKGEEVNTEKLSSERAREILDDMERYEFGSRNHALFTVLWATGCRTSGARALDVDDFDAENQSLEFEHRPSSGTPLKNRAAGNRHNSLSEDVCEVLKTYIRLNREHAVDESGREPLFSTNQGRISKSYVRVLTYQITHPCNYGPCPHDREKRSCEARDHGHESKCPSARSPHRIRTGAVTHMRDEGAPIRAVGERVDATPETLKLHYDFSDERNRMEHRRDVFEEINL